MRRQDRLHTKLATPKYGCDPSADGGRNKGVPLLGKPGERRASRSFAAVTAEKMPLPLSLRRFARSYYREAVPLRALMLTISIARRRRHSNSQASSLLGSRRSSSRARGSSATRFVLISTTWLTVMAVGSPGNA